MNHIATSKIPQTVYAGGLPAVFRDQPLFGLEIMATRIAASRSTFPTLRRWRMWRYNKSHVGDKQVARRIRNEARLAFSA